jgi:uncharacterized protein YndB with AHSA1/START domain/DNA-binding transcriptional ArsR family regulator
MAAYSSDRAPEDRAPEDRAPEDDVFRALADPSRRELLDRLNSQGGQSLVELCAGLDMKRQSVSKHLAILERADLVVTSRRGRVKLHYLNAAPINEISERWINRYHRHRFEALSDLKRALEGDSMQRLEFVYKTYINTTPEKLWQALTDPAFTKRYWGLSFVSDWRVGSTITWELEGKGVSIADPAQVIVESEPFRRLSYTWHTFTKEWAGAYGISPEATAVYAGEPRSKVTFEIEQVGQMVRLTVLHDGFDEGSAVLGAISDGWPLLMSSLKTLLETGEVLPEATPASSPAESDSSRR